MAETGSTFNLPSESVAKEEKRVKDLFGDAKKRAQRRRAYYDSKLGDPMQLLRVSGMATKLVTNPESYSFNEDPKNLMPWASDPAIKIDRFDGRALLDYLPTETPAMVDSGLRMERDEDGIGDELRFERWFDLVEKSRLHISEEQCLTEMEEEWNDLIARHHALIGKNPEKKSETSTGSFGFNYGTKIVQNDDDGYGQMDRELPAMEEENILEHLDRLSQQDRDTLDQLGTEFSIKDYYHMLRIAKRDQDDRVRQLKVTAVNLERAMAGKKPLKMSSRSGSESPKEDTLEFISEFKNDSNAETSDDEGVPEVIPDSDRFKRTKMGSSPQDKRLSSSSIPSPPGRPWGVSSGSSSINPTKAVADMKLSLVEKLKQRMRQGLDSVRSNDTKKHAKESGDLSLGTHMSPKIGVVASGVDREERSRDSMSEKRPNKSRSRSRSRSRRENAEMTKTSLVINDAGAEAEAKVEAGRGIVLETTTEEIASTLVVRMEDEMTEGDMTRLEGDRGQGQGLQCRDPTVLGHDRDREDDPGIIEDEEE
ncbi:hypothetical protein BGZ82_010105 [Podila clonocystis]|nr:hypothetical protein BGZ82_010105 [Podila clonocystis]